MSGMLHGGPGDPRPVRGNNPTSLNEARNELRRLMGLLMRANKAYHAREAELVRLNASGKHNYSGSLVTVLNNDLLLNNTSGMSKTISVLLQGVSAYIVAELAMRQRSPQERDRDMAEEQ